jgi:hypothetical protein
LVSSNWIWTDKNFLTVNPQAVRDFRREVMSPANNTATDAQIIIAADNNYTLYVNGDLIGQGNDWEVSQQYCVTLESDCNVFAVAVENEGTTPNPAAWIAAIQINYEDGSSEVIRTDTEWRDNNATAGFQNIGFDDSSWPFAVIAGSSSSSPWHVPYGPYNSSSASIANALWVWTNEVPPNSPTSTAPVGSRAFRKDITIPGGAKASSGVIAIDADNEYVLYINGNLIGTGNNWPTAQSWTFTLDEPTSNIVIAVNATNTGGPAGLIASVGFDAELADCDCSTTLFYTTDGTWKFNTSVPAGFQQPTFDDSAWKNVVVEGPYGVAPWNNVPTTPE